MYLSYYNLKIKPFQMSTNPEFLWLGEKHKEALAVLKYAIMENKGVLALTGDVGTGKTTLINALLKSLGKDTITATIYDARLDVLDFFNTVAAAFKIKGTFDGKGKFIIQFMEFLIKAHEQNRKVLLIIDEAQGISKDLLEEIRLLSNLEAEYTRLLNIFFVGQNEFIDILQKYENRALRQRVTIRYHIDPLTLNETAAYIRHRLEVSGTTAPIFDSGAIDEIYFFSGGYPRLINIMCDHALLTGYVREVRSITANHIRECREELLVSKKSSENYIDYPAGNQQTFSSEPMTPGPPEEPLAPDPPKEPTDSDLTREVMDYVKDYQFSENDHDSFGAQYSMPKPGISRKNQHKRPFNFRSIMIFLLVAGIGAVYFFYGNNHSKTPSHVTADPQQPKKYFSMNAKPENKPQSTDQTRPEATDTPEQAQADKPGNSHFPIVDVSNSGISKTNVPNETASFRPSPSKTFSQGAEAASFSKKPDASEFDAKALAMKSDPTASLDATHKETMNTRIKKEAPPETSSDSAVTGPDLTEESKTPALPSKEQLEKVPASDRKMTETAPTSSTAVVALKNPPAKTPPIIPAPTIKPDDSHTAASELIQDRTSPKLEKSAEKAALKPAEKPEAAAKSAQSVPKQNKAKTSESRVRETPEKKIVVASSDASEKQTTKLFEKFKDNLSKKAAISDAEKPAAPLKTIKEKTPAAGSIAEPKKRENQTAANREVQNTGEKIASLGIPADKSGKTDKTELKYIPLITRLESFLKKYCRTYEQKNMDKFSALFALNAIEKGKPFKSLLPTYRQNFKRLDSIDYQIELKRYATQEDTGLVKVDGAFHIKARLDGSQKELNHSGDISMILEADGNSFKVKELNY